MPTILAIDPGTKEMGISVLTGGALIASGVHTLRNGGRPHDVIGQARAIVFRYVRDHGPDIVAIEKPLRKTTKRAALVFVIVQELHARSRELGMQVILRSPRDVRADVVGDPHATKFDVARVLGRRFPQLVRQVPPARPHRVLGFRSRDRYWLHMFDALAVGIAVEQQHGRDRSRARCERASCGQ